MLDRSESSARPGAIDASHRATACTGLVRQQNVRNRDRELPRRAVRARKSIGGTKRLPRAGRLRGRCSRRRRSRTARPIQGVPEPAHHGPGRSLTNARRNNGRRRARRRVIGKAGHGVALRRGASRAGRLSRAALDKCPRRVDDILTIIRLGRPRQEPPSQRSDSRAPSPAPSSRPPRRRAGAAVRPPDTPVSSPPRRASSTIGG